MSNSHFWKLIPAMALFLTPMFVYAAPRPHLMNYQGRLTDSSGKPVSGYYKVQFTIYDDAAGGTSQWEEKDDVTTDADGLFSILLGSLNPIPPEIFDGTARYLAIAIEGEPEFAPRVQLTSSPQAFYSDNAQISQSTISAPGYLPLSGGTMTGTTLHYGAASRWQSGGSDRVSIFPDFSLLSMAGPTGNATVSLDGYAAGNLTLFDGTPGANLTVALTGNYAGGGSLRLGYPGNLSAIELDASGTGNASVILPTDAINSQEILDEAGIAADKTTSTATLDCTTTVNFIASVTLTTPAPGYIVLDGRTNATLLSDPNASGTPKLIIGIDTTTNDYGYYSNPFSAVVTAKLTSTAASMDSITVPASVYSIFYKPAGLRTFFLRAGYVGACTGLHGRVTASMLRATYYPTSYGSVVTMVSSGDLGQFENATAVTIRPDPLDSAKTETQYLVDLRELELRATKAQAEADRLQRQLLEEKLKQVNEKSVD